MMLYGGCGVAGCLDCEPVILVADDNEYENAGDNPLIGVKTLMVKEGTVIVVDGADA